MGSRFPSAGCSLDSDARCLVVLYRNCFTPIAVLRYFLFLHNLRAVYLCYHNCMYIHASGLCMPVY